MVIRFENLLNPITPDSPSGDGYLYSRQLRESFSALRKPEQPNSEADTNYRRAADWSGLEKLAQSALAEQTKDIRIVCHLIEAWTQIRGFAGLHDGLKLLTEFVATCWDRSYPLVDDQDDWESRLAPLENMLDDIERGSCFPLTVRHLALLGDVERSCDYYQFQELQQAKTEAATLELERLVASSSADSLSLRAQQIADALAQLAALKAALEQRVGQQAPGFTYLRDALRDCQRIVLAYAPATPPSTGSNAAELDLLETSASTRPEADASLAEPSADFDGAPHSTAAPSGASPASSTAPLLNSRSAAYQQLDAIAEYLKQTEPHSPVPYLIQRAVKLGQMPFPVLAQQMIREEGILDELKREFGIGSLMETSSD